MGNIREHVCQSLPSRLNIEDFREVTLRLMASGVIARSGSATEALLYDTAYEIEDILSDIFTTLGFPFQHDKTALTFRLFAPGARVPGLENPETESVGSIAMTVSPDLAATYIALWLLYREGIERNSLNENGERVVSLNELDACLSTQLHVRALDRLTDRRELLRAARAQRVIRLPEDGVDLDVDAGFAIQRGILSLVSESAAEAALIKVIAGEQAQ